MYLTLNHFTCYTNWYHHCDTWRGMTFTFSDASGEPNLKFPIKNMSCSMINTLAAKQREIVLHVLVGTRKHNKNQSRNPFIFVIVNMGRASKWHLNVISYATIIIKLRENISCMYQIVILLCFNAGLSRICENFKVLKEDYRDIKYSIALNR